MRKPYKIGDAELRRLPVDVLVKLAVAEIEKASAILEKQIESTFMNEQVWFGPTNSNFTNNERKKIWQTKQSDSG